MLRKFQRKGSTIAGSRNITDVLLLTGIFLILIIVCLVDTYRENTILISEFYLPDKKTTLVEQDAYIEIANTGMFSYKIEDLYLSDDPNHVHKQQISSQIVSARGTVLVSIDSDVLDFGEKGGDVLILSNQSGDILDQVILGDTRKNKSYTRNYIEDTWEYRTPSPGAYNLERPEFSVTPGFYDEAFYVELSSLDGADIYYTLDGSTPTVQSERYTEKIYVYDRSGEENQFRNIQNVTTNWKENPPYATPVPKATIIRAIAVNEDGSVSEIATATYFVNQGYLKDAYVVSLIADPEDLFGPNGIYSTGEAYDQWYLNGQIGSAPTPNYEIKGVEAAGNFELFNATEQGYLNQQCGIRIQGWSARKEIMKRLSIFSREEYSGSKFFEQNIFGNARTHSVVLRDGTSNAFSMELVPDRNVATQKSIPVRVYLNGEYWYDTYLQEKYSDEYFEETYELDDVEFIKAGVIQEMLDFVIENDMQTEEAYQRLNEIIDVQSYIDYMCANVYLANTDYAESTGGGNSAIWRTKKVENSSMGDGRWRWALFDMDLLTEYCKVEWGMTDVPSAWMNTFVNTRPWTGSLDNRPFYSSLKKNPQFREDFVLTFMDMANTCLAPDSVEPIINYMWRPDIEYGFTFFQERKSWISAYLADSYGLEGSQEPLTLEISDAEAGDIRVNTCKPDLKNGAWTGTYFTDYPVTISAEAYDGYRFVRWEGDICSEESELSFILPEGGVSIRAIYEAYED